MTSSTAAHRQPTPAAHLHLDSPAVPAGDIDALTDLGNARRFVAAAGDRFLYVPARGWGWLHYDGMRWRRDSTDQAMEVAATVPQMIREEAHNTRDLKRHQELLTHAKNSQSRRAMRAMIDTAGEALPHLKATVDEFDNHPHLLNCANGTVDLRTGELLPHDPAHCITQLVPAIYNPDAVAPLWEQTLREVLPDDEVRAFFQRAVGYTATGSTTEHALFFCYGGGRNGKSLLVGTVLDVLGDYATPAPPNILMKTNTERHSTEIQNLRGYRMVKVDETGRGKAWNEERLKQLTGGDKLKARRMYEDFDEGFDPTHKFWVLSNYMPRVTGTDHGIWSRLKMIEFPVRFCEPGDEEGRRAGLSEQRKALREELMQEREGILRWLVEGAVSWAREGLRVPRAVRAATAEYRDEQDTFRDFIEWHTALRDLPPGPSRLTLPDVAGAYQSFSLGKADVENLSSREIAQELRCRGYGTKRGAKGVTLVVRAGGAR